MISQFIGRVIALIPGPLMFPIFLAIGAWFLWRGWTARPSGLKASLAKVA